MSEITVFNLQIKRGIVEDILPFHDELTLIGPLYSGYFSMPDTLSKLEFLLQEAKKSVNFNVKDQVHVIAPPTIQSMLLIAGIMSAFEKVTVWITTEKGGHFLELSDFVRMGSNFANECKVEALQERTKI